MLYEVITLCFFVIIMLVLNLLFPYGGLQLFNTSEILATREQADSGQAGSSIKLDRNGKADTFDGGDWAATLVELRNQVT